MKPAKHQYTILKQICQHIPAHLVPKLARSFGVDKKARSFSPWSHVVAMLHVQIAHDSNEEYRRWLKLMRGEIAGVHKAEGDFTLMAELDGRCYFRITWAKDNRQYRMVKQHTISVTVQGILEFWATHPRSNTHLLNFQFNS